jgi:hypothetical protein
MKPQIEGMAASGMIYSRYKLATSVGSTAITGHSVFGDIRMFFARATKSTIAPAVEMLNERRD